ncbi:hypothetical protein HYW61_00135 [candidate division WWE3 bacterium]|nr:hypothetical protein [candidate division WWE3 bacterium]
MNLVRNQKGQAFLFIIVVMTVALALGIGVSLRTLSSISRVSTTDTASRALAAAEGGAERFLSLPDSKLSDAVDGNCPENTASDDEKCRVSFKPVAADNIVAVSDVTVDYYGSVGAGGSFATDAAEGNISEVNLDGYGDSKIEICWSSAGQEGSDIYLFAYNSNGDVTKEGVSSSAPKDGLYTQGGFANGGGGRDAFDNCYTFELPSSPKGLRIQALNEDINLGIYPKNDSLPAQGYEITSVGQLLDAGDIKATKKIVVKRSFPYLPHPFSFGAYSGNEVLD